MKRVLCTLLLCLLLVPAGCAKEGETADTPDALDAALRDGQISEMQYAEQFALGFFAAKQAQLTGDGADTAPYFAENAADRAYFDEKQAELAARYAESVEPGSSAYDTRVTAAVREGETLRVAVTEDWTYRAADGGETASVRTVYTLVLIRQDRGWRIDTFAGDTGETVQPGS